jgi:hypothetical protein
MAAAAYGYGSSAMQNGLIRATVSVDQRAETLSSADFRASVAARHDRGSP